MSDFRSEMKIGNLINLMYKTIKVLHIISGWQYLHFYHIFLDLIAAEINNDT